MLDELQTGYEKKYTTIIENYQFNDRDISNLNKILPTFQRNIDLFLENFYNFIFKFEHAKKFIKDEYTLQKHKSGISKWFIDLFVGPFDSKYFQKLNRISEVHVKIGLPHHYVNAAFSFVRRFLKDILIKEEQLKYLSSVDKIIDINLDILTISYNQEEQTKLIDDIVFIKECIKKDKILPYFQPIYDAKTLKVSKYESLMRLQKENTMEVVSVYPYLKTAKKIKIYEELTKNILFKVFSYMKNKNCEFSINLDYEDITNKNILDTVFKYIKEFETPELIIFEIVESEFIDDFKVVEQFANKARESGCKIAIDDFGSGYSNMENILKLKPDIIKIDGTLIKNLDSCKDSQTIVKNIVNMANGLKAYIVAEYIHSKEVKDTAVDMGIDYLQGFYLSEPKPSIE